MNKTLTKLMAVLLALFTISVYQMFAIDNNDADAKYLKDQLPMLLGSNNAGTQFYMTFHPCWEETGPNNAIRIYVSAAVATRVTLEIEGLGYKQTQITIPNDVIEFKLAPTQAQMYSKTDRVPPEPLQVWQKRACVITSEDPIICYGVTRFRYTSDGYLAVPTSSLGKEYIVASWADPADEKIQWLTSFTSVVGVYDNTKVTFRAGGGESTGNVLLPNNDTLRPNESVKTVLFPGDVWLIPSIGPFSDISGSKITANKPVAVVSGSFCAYIPTWVSACDFISEFELPSNTWGTKYHISNIQDRLKNSWVKIFCKRPQTYLYRDGLEAGMIQTPGGTTGKGYLEQLADEGKPRPVTISSDPGFPIYIVQYNAGQSDDGVSSDPFQMVLTPIEQYQNEIVFNTPGIRGGYGFQRNYINIVYKANKSGGIPDDMQFGTVSGGQVIWRQLNAVDGNPGMALADVDPKDGRQYKAKTIKLAEDGVYRIKGDDKFACYAYGFAEYDSYGFPVSVALADLEIPDTLAPTVIYSKPCDGDIQGGVVIDEPQTDPENRSNLGLVYLDAASSYNYDFEPGDFVPGNDMKANWNLTVMDKTENAVANLVFQDRVGNTTDTTIHHFAIKAIAKTSDKKYRKDYGTFKLQTPSLKKSFSFTITNDGDQPIPATYQAYVTLDSKENDVDKPNDINTYQNFDILKLSKVNIAPLNIGETKTFDIEFNASKLGAYADSLGVIVINETGDTCLYKYFVRLTAFVGNPNIACDDHNFLKQTVASRTAPYTMQIANRKSDGATVPLLITGLTFSDPTIMGLKGSGAVFEVDFGRTIDAANPLQVELDQPFTYNVTFRPDAVKTYLGRIDFQSEATGPKPFAIIEGEGIQPDLAANSYNWQKRRVDPNSYKTEPGPYPFTPYTSGTPNPFGTQVIELKNDGTEDVVLSGYDITLDNKGDYFFIKDKTSGKLVSLKDNSTELNNFSNVVIPKNGGTVSFPVYYHPALEGLHELTLKFTSNAPVTPESELKGTGIFPKGSTKDVTFGTFIVGTNVPVKRTVEFKNTNWNFEDAMTITGFTTKVDANTTITDQNGNGIIRYFTNTMKDNAGATVNFPVKVNPGESFFVEVEYLPTAVGNFAAYLTTVSDLDKEVTAKLSGDAIAEGTQMTTASVVTCVGLKKTISPKIKNTGSVAATVSNIRVVIKNAPKGNTADFVLTSAPTFKLNPGEDLPITFDFTPSTVYNNATFEVICDLNLQTKIKDNVEITVTGTNETIATKSYVRSSNGTKGTSLEIEPGIANGIIYSIEIDNAAKIVDATKTTYIVTVDYRKDFLGTTSDKINVGAKFASLGFTKESVSAKIIKDTPEELIERLTIRIKGNKPVVDYVKGDELVNITFDAYLMWYKKDDGTSALKSKTSTIAHTVTAESETCIQFGNTTSNVNLKETCVDPLRPIVINNTQFNLGSVNPNPVGANGADINFSVGLDCMTEIKIYNSNGEVVAIPVSGDMKVGTYNVRIPVEQLSSGAYYYEMTSGPFKATEKLIINK